MLKKIIPLAISLYLIFSISVMAENEIPANETTVPQASEQLPQGTDERPQGRENTGVPPSGNMQNRGTPPNIPDGEQLPEGINRGQAPSGDFTPPQNTEPQKNENLPQSTSETDETTENKTSADEQTNPNTDEALQHGVRIPNGVQGGFPGNMQSFDQQDRESEPMTFIGFIETYSTPITSVVLLALAFVFVIFYKRRNY